MVWVVFLVYERICHNVCLHQLQLVPNQHIAEYSSSIVKGILCSISPIYGSKNNNRDIVYYTM